MAGTTTTTTKTSATSASDRRSSGFRSLLGMLAYLRRYPGALAVSVGLLLVNIAIEMTLPRIIGSALTQLERHRASGAGNCDDL